jgi:lactate dehydrogenase-like 2-hydroxyacid dehydrogenase
MKLVLLDGEALNPGDLSWAPLEALGELTVYPRGTADPEEIIRRIGDAEIVLTNKTPIGRGIFERCPNMKLLCVVATGYNVVDTAAAKEHGVPVCNVPAYGTEMVAQFAIGLLLEICHHVQLHNGVRAQELQQLGAGCNQCVDLAFVCARADAGTQISASGLGAASKVLRLGICARQPQRAGRCRRCTANLVGGLDHQHAHASLMQA